MIVETVRKSNEIFGGFISGKLLDSAIIGILAYVVLTIMRMPDTILLAVIIGVTNIIAVDLLENKDENEKVHSLQRILQYNDKE